MAKYFENQGDVIKRLQFLIVEKIAKTEQNFRMVVPLV